MTQAAVITEKLLRAYPQPKLALHFRNPLQLLVAVLLSAQSTDERVNAVTKDLFVRYKRAEDFANAKLATLERDVHATGFYKRKAKALRDCCRQLVKRHGGKVPGDLDALTALPGVGRKSANMVLGNAFGQQTIAVDTHVSRVSQRLGLVAGGTPDQIEQALLTQIDDARRTAFTNAMILHGRQVCMARRPECCACVLYQQCEWSEKQKCP